MNAVWLRFRAEMRRSWRGWLGVALLAGLTSGAVLATTAAGRRADTAYPRFLADSNAWDVAVQSTVVDLDAVRRIPSVVDAVRIGYVFLDIDRNLPEGKDLTPLANEGFDRVNRPKLIAGRRSDPAKPLEVTLTPAVAKRDRLGVGSRIPVRLFAVEQVESLFSNNSTAPSGPDVVFEVVGVEVAPSEFQSANSLTMHLSSGFLKEYGDVAAIAYGLAVRLERGAADVNAFKAAVDELTGGAPAQFITQAEDAAGVQRTIHLQAVALWVFAALTAAATVLILGQALARLGLTTATDQRTLWALGMTRGQLVGVGLLRSLAIGAVAAALAAGIAVAASPVLSFGLAELAEPNPGLAADLTVLGLGAVATVGGIVLVTLFPVWSGARLAATGAAGRDHRSRPLRLAGALARAGLPPSAVAGVRMATVPGRGASAVPVRTAIFGAAVGIAGVAAALTFAASLDHLFQTPRLYGWDWHAVYGNPYALTDVADDFGDRLTGLDEISGMAGVSFAQVEVDGDRTQALAFRSVQGTITPPLVAGRAPRQPDEIAIGSKVQGGRAIGDTVPVKVGDTTIQARIVGRAVFPSLGQYDTGGLGDGALMTFEGMQRLVPEVRRNLFAVRFGAGVATPAGLAAVAARLTETDTADPDRGQPPKTVADFGGVDAMPGVLAGLVGLIAAATLAHAVVTTVRRRRRELAVLKTIGFVRRQVAAAVFWQATTLAVVAMAGGIPVGVAAGRWAWRIFATNLGIVPEPIVPVATIAAIVPVAFLLANVVAAAPGRAAARVQPALALRAE